jgi:hypothetical protein
MVNKEHLLEEAKRRFLVGTKFYLAHDNTKISEITKKCISMGK